MARLCVWAPLAQKIELEFQNKKTALQKDVNGWWFIDDSTITHGTKYAYFVDGNGPFPDPRSYWQPEGVHGPSCWLDHSKYIWHDASWKSPSFESSIFYELHIPTFTPEGTFEAVIEKLDCLVELGITHIEFMPVAECSGSYGWGYDVVDLYAPHHSYGGPEGLKKLVDACHMKGLAVVLDVVYNHLGPEGNYLHKFGPYFTKKYTTPWGDAVNFDGPYSDEVRRFVIDNARMWIDEYHIDGLRVDAVHAIIDTSAIHILEELKNEIKTLLIAESDLNDTRIIKPPDVGGYGFDAQWNEDFHHALHAYITGEKHGYFQDFQSLQDLAFTLKDGFLYGGRYSPYRRRRHGRSAKDISFDRFISFLQNHDQIGNRAKGERIGHLVSIEKLKVGASLVMLSSYHPMLFQGEEWASSSPFLYFTDYKDPSLKAAVTEGRQREFNTNVPFDPHAKETFLRSKLNWSEQNEEPHKEILQWYQKLIALRKKLPASQSDISFSESNRWLLLKRESVILICNFNEEPQHIPYESAEDLNEKLFSDQKIEVVNNTIFFPKCGVAIFYKIT